ncbi:MAG: DUF308 domain-containing protein [Lachnospiraceae bacterium]|nr:DUF308 domain-containing protein [Lachnospiraceae bacterium]
MKSREELKTIMENAPAPKAHKRGPRQFKSIKGGRIYALLLMTVGILCLFCTAWMHRALPFIVGIFLEILGLGSLTRGIMTGEYRNPETKLTSSAVVYLVLGAVILWHHANADEVIGSIWGILGLIKGAEVLNEAICSMAAHESFVMKMIQAAVEVALGILLLVNPTESVRHHVFLLGLELVMVSWQIAKELYR